MGVIRVSVPEAPGLVGERFAIALLLYTAMDQDRSSQIVLDLGALFPPRWEFSWKKITPLLPMHRPVANLQAFVIPQIFSKSQIQNLPLYTSNTLL